MLLPCSGRLQQRFCSTEMTGSMPAWRCRTGQNGGKEEDPKFGGISTLEQGRERPVGKWVRTVESKSWRAVAR